MPDWTDVARRARAAGLRTFGRKEGEILYEPADGTAPFTISGIFDEEHVAVDVGAEAQISSQGPTLAIDLSEFPSYPHGGWVTVGGVRYRVDDTPPDGQGGAHFILDREDEL